MAIMGSFCLGFGLYRLIKIDQTHQVPTSQLGVFAVGAAAVLVVVGANSSTRHDSVTSARRKFARGLILPCVCLLFLTLPEKDSNAYFFPARFQLLGDGAMAMAGVLILGYLVFSRSLHERLRGGLVVPPASSTSAPSGAAVTAVDATDSSLAWLQTAEFRLKLRGYNVDEVDAYLDEAVTRSSSNSSQPLSPDELRHKKFSVSLKGYDVTQVDEALERAASQLGSSWT